MEETGSATQWCEIGSGSAIPHGEGTPVENILDLNCKGSLNSINYPEIISMTRYQFRLMYCHSAVPPKVITELQQLCDQRNYFDLHSQYINQSLLKAGKKPQHLPL